MAKVTQEDIIKLNELYLKIGTYAGVSRAMGGSPSPSTVKKYIIKDYVSQNNLNKVTFKIEDVPSFPNDKLKEKNNWGNLCKLSEEEKEEIKKLWDELSI